MKRNWLVWCGVIGVAVALSLSVMGCKSSVEDAIDVIDEPGRRPIDRTRLAINAFANDGRFGSIGAQFSEIRSTLGINHVRVLFAWNDDVQSSPGAPINFSFYDDILAGIPAGMDALVVLTNVPSWMGNQANWINGDPRETFVQEWVTPVIARYGGTRKIVGFQVWNEPNGLLFGENTVLGLIDKPENYVALLARAHNVIREGAPGKLVVSAATTAINQNFPESLNYNRAMRDAGAEQFMDVWAIHYYGKQYENVVRPGGVQDFLNGVSRRIWLTESGSQGVNTQHEYVERTWPFLQEKLGGRIERFYYYQFAEATDAGSTYGVKNLTPGAELSDLYVHLRDS